MTTEVPISNPYVGPRTFSYRERRLFFGREREARDLLARVLSERLLLFYAQSGAGKSSLLYTSLIPQLQEEKGFVVLPVGRVGGELPAGVEQVEDIYAFNLMASVDEGDDPARLVHVSLSDFLARLARRTITDAAGQERKVWVYDASLAPGPATTGPTARRYALIIDQFEETMTSHPAHWQEREDFFRQLNQALLDDPNLWVVLTLREDYVAALDPYAPLMTDRLRARFYMERMGLDAALDAIRRPAELGGRPYAAGVAEQLVEDLRQVRVPGQEATIPGQYVEPVQLQVVCYQLWEQLKVRPPRPIAMADLDEAGNVERALADYYDQVIREVLAAPGIQVLEDRVRDWFDKELITEAGTRGFVPQIGDHTGGVPNEAVNLLEKRFLVRRDPRAGGVWYELTHDTFIKPIQKSNREWREAQRPPEIVDFTISPTVVSPGVSVMVRWQVQNAESVKLEPGELPLRDLHGEKEVMPASTTAYVLRAGRFRAPTVVSRPLTVIVAKGDLETTRYGLSRHIREGRFNVLVGPEIDRELLPFSAAIAAEDWAAEALTGHGLPLWERYLRFLKERLIEEAITASQGDGQVAVDDLGSTTVSELACRLGYLERHPERRGLLDALVAVPAPLYVTTSYHTLLEEALRTIGRQPQTGVCRWLPGSDTLLTPFDYEPGYEPSAARPAVFHLYGLDVSPKSLALTEDDYVTFLMQVREDRERIPLFVRYALRRHFSVLAGFDPQAWSFKALYHGLIAWNDQRRSGGLLQIDSLVERTEAEIRFLEASFTKHGLKLFWGGLGSFLEWAQMASQEADKYVRSKADIDRWLRPDERTVEEEP